MWINVKIKGTFTFANGRRFWSSLLFQLNHQHPDHAYNCNCDNGLDNRSGRASIRAGVAQVGGAARVASLTFTSPLRALSIAILFLLAPQMHVDDLSACCVFHCCVLANLIFFAFFLSCPFRFVSAVWTVAFVALQSISCKKELKKKVI